MAQPGAWPSPSDYSTAIQNPRHCFTDPELQAGQVAANALGLPLGASGNFAVVYRLQCPARAFAVRCFIRTVTGQQQRYDAISRYLDRIAFSALVIYLSFLALSADPGLWVFHTGENLIFVAEDYRAPGRTPIWDRVQGSGDAEVRRLSATLGAFCRQSVATLPGLATALAGVPLRAAAAVAASPAAPPPRPVYQMPPRSVAPVAPSAVICPRCERDNAVDVVYCEHCTHQLCGNRFCPRCDSSIPVKAHYCPHCGNRL